MKCLDNMCQEAAIENDSFEGVLIRTCKNGHRTGKYAESEEVKTTMLHEAA